jgi:hypothetical protein
MLINSTGKNTPCSDWRHITQGTTIPVGAAAGFHYADQPYIIQADDGALLCLVTTGKNNEGHTGQHVRSIRSPDGGKTWEVSIALETPEGPEASYAVALKGDDGRIFAFYNHNTDNIRRVRFEDPNCPDGCGKGDGYCYRVDSLGYFVFKVSSDHGKTWSEQRFPIDVREMETDRTNADGGKVRYFWNVGRPFIHQGAAYIPLHKVGGFGMGFFIRSEGVLLKSENLLTASDPTKATFETLPDGDFGLRAPKGGGPISEEHSFSVLSDGTFFVVYRTVAGYPTCAYSSDQGHNWSEPDYLRYADGRRIKNPRAANFCWKHSSGYYLYWFHNHNGTNYEYRNPVWMCAAREIDSPEGKRLEFSQPEIVLYDDDPLMRMSYPDMFELDGKTYLTETEKRIARLHELKPEFLETLFDSFEGHTTSTEGLISEWSAEHSAAADAIAAPDFPFICFRQQGWEGIYSHDSRAGTTLEFSLTAYNLDDGTQTILDNREADGKGFTVLLHPNGALELTLFDGRSRSAWTSSSKRIQPGAAHHVCIIIDGGPKTISFVIDGAFDDGGEEKQFGFGLFNCHFHSLNGGEQIRLGDTLQSLRIYGRALMTSEAVQHHRASARTPEAVTA